MKTASPSLLVLKRILENITFKKKQHVLLNIEIKGDSMIVAKKVFATPKFSEVKF